MGLFSGIGKFIGKVARGVGKVAGTVAKVANFLQKPLSALTEPIKKAVGGLVGKIPLVGKYLQPFVDKFIDSGLAFLAGGPLGGIGILAKALPTIAKIGDFAEKIAQVANRVGATFTPEGQFNLQNIFAHAHAQKLLAQ